MSIKPYFESKHCTLYHGDCLKIMPQLAPVELLLTDPPYGIGIANNPVRQKHERQNWDAAPPQKFVFDMMLAHSSHQVIWGGNYFDLPASQGFFIWDKVQPQDFSLAMCEFAWSSKQSPAKMFKKSVLSYVKKHPTQKPVVLMEWCMSFFPDAKTVLDPFMGSGTTGVACCKTNRQFIGIEMEEKYCEIAAKRIERAEIDAAQNLFFEPEPIVPEKQMEMTL